MAARKKAGPVEPQPVVVLDVELHEGLLELVLRNAGAGSARELSVRWSKSVPWKELWGDVPYLAPGREHRVLLGRSRDLLLAFEARLAWRDAAGRRHADRIRHDLSVFRPPGGTHVRC